ncbi:MAG: CsbD family protein [Stellaceae bacterium]
MKEAAGRALGDRKMESEGRAKKTEGKVQNAVGGARDKIRESVKND